MEDSGGQEHEAQEETWGMLPLFTAWLWRFHECVHSSNLIKLYTVNIWGLLYVNFKVADFKTLFEKLNGSTKWTVLYGERAVREQSVKTPRIPWGTNKSAVNFPILPTSWGSDNSVYSLMRFPLGLTLKATCQHGQMCQGVTWLNSRQQGYNNPTSELLTGSTLNCWLFALSKKWE